MNEHSHILNIPRVSFVLKPEQINPSNAQQSTMPTASGAFLRFLLTMRDNAVSPIIQVNYRLPCLEIETENRLVLLDSPLVSFAGRVGFGGV